MLPLNCFTSYGCFWRNMAMGVPTSSINSWIYCPPPLFHIICLHNLDMENQWSLPPSMQNYSLQFIFSCLAQSGAFSVSKGWFHKQTCLAAEDCSLILSLNSPFHNFLLLFLHPFVLQPGTFQWSAAATKYFHYPMWLRKFSGISPAPCRMTDCSHIPESCVCKPPHTRTIWKTVKHSCRTNFYPCFQEWKPESLSIFFSSMEVVAWLGWTNTLSRTVTEFKPASRCSLNVNIALIFFWQV